MLAYTFQWLDSLVPSHIVLLIGRGTLIALEMPGLLNAKVLDSKEQYLGQCHSLHEPCHTFASASN